VKVHDVFLAAFRTQALDFALIVIKSGLRVVIQTERLRVFEVLF